MKEPDIIHRLEREMLEKRERVREILREEGRPDLVEELDKNLRDVDLGLARARGTWHALSEPQRKLLLLLVREGVRLQKRGTSTIYDAVGASAKLENVTRLKTVRSLLARELLQCEGGAFDPEAVVTLTEKGKFVVDKGQTEGEAIG